MLLFLPLSARFGEIRRPCVGLGQQHSRVEKGRKGGLTDKTAQNPSKTSRVRVQLSTTVRIVLKPGNNLHNPGITTILNLRHTPGYSSRDEHLSVKKVRNVPQMGPYSFVRLRNRSDGRRVLPYWF